VGRLAHDVEKRPADEPVAFRHSPNASWSTSPRESEQNRFGLIVTGVPCQNDIGTVAFGGASQGRVSGIAGRCFGPSLGSHHNANDLDWFEPEGQCRFRRHSGDRVASRLNSVIDNNCARAQSPFRRDKPSGRGERQRIGSTAQCHQNE
jgi:hypothetical protein